MGIAPVTEHEALNNDVIPCLQVARHSIYYTSHHLKSSRRVTCSAPLPDDQRD